MKFRNTKYEVTEYNNGEYSVDAVKRIIFFIEYVRYNLPATITRSGVRFPAYRHKSIDTVREAVKEHMEEEKEEEFRNGIKRKFEFKL